MTVKAHTFNGDDICDSCGFECEHPDSRYTQTSETHQLMCDDCGMTEKAEAHTTYYGIIDSESCGTVCYVCGPVEGSEKPHLITDYYIYDEEYCIKVCENCEYGNEETGLVKHSFNRVVVPATEKEAEHTKYTCKNCEYSYKEYNAENAIMFKLYRDIREILARNKDFIYCIIKPEPTYLGDEIPVWGNGNATNDK